MEEVFMKQIIKFIDVDVDGCGTNIESMIGVEGKQELTNGIIQRVRNTRKKIMENMILIALLV
jgi:hypothetical protein